MEKPEFNNRFKNRSQIMKEMLAEKQCRFCKGKACTDVVFTLM
jgi:hypothetical protein